MLIIDEVGYTKLSPGQAHHFFELVTARYEHGSILLTSNTMFAALGSLLGDEVLASALLDRLLYHAEVIAINGSSYRMKERRRDPAGSDQSGRRSHVSGRSGLTRWGHLTLARARLSLGAKRTVCVLG